MIQFDLRIFFTWVNTPKKSKYLLTSFFFRHIFQGSKKYRTSAGWFGSLGPARNENVAKVNLEGFTVAQLGFDDGIIGKMMGKLPWDG